MNSNNARERRIEQRLSQLESPEPPAELLDRIRRDIPEYLRPVGAGETPPRRRLPLYRLAAASLFLAVVGGFLAYRVQQSAPDPTGALVATDPETDAAVELPTLTTEIGPATESSDTSPQPTPAAVASPPPAPELPASTGQAVTSEGRAKQEPLGQLPGPTARADGDDAQAGALATTEVGPPTLPDEEMAAQLKRRAKHPGEMKEEERVRQAEEVLVESRPTTTPQEPLMATHSPTRAAGGAAARTKALHQRLEAPVASPPPSTGGTTEPNDQPWGDMFFRPYGTNPFIDTEDDAQSTFGLDVDTGSYTLARGYLERGHLPPAEAIRVEEFLNFFDYGDPAPRRGEFTLTAEGAPSPWQRGPRYQLLRIGVRAREISARQRKDATLIFVVDVSGSMAQQNRIGMVKQALRLLVDQLGRGDQVGLVVYGSNGQVLLEPSSDLSSVRRAIERLTTGGSTNAEEGLLLGYQLARRHYRPGAINRLVLCSDGVANVGRTGPESILARIGREADEGIELTTVGFGLGNYNDVLMEQLADQGDGNYAYVDTMDEAHRVFVENLTGTLQTVASDAKIQVEFDPRTVSRYRLLGYENRDVADHRFRDDTVDAGELGAGHRVTALYELKLTEQAPRHRPLAEVRLRYRSKETGRVVEESLEVGRDQLARSWRAASPSLRLAALAAEVAEVLKRSYWTRETRPEDLLARARQVSHDSRGDEDVSELVRLTERVARLVDWSEEPPE